MAGSGFLGKSTNEERDFVSALSNSEVETKMGEIPGEIVSFDPEKQTAVVLPLYMPKVNGKPISMPELVDVPVRFQRAGHASITFPVIPGDIVLLRPQMRSTENYHEGNDHVASDSRYNSLSDMEAYIDGGEKLTSPIENFDPNNFHVRFNETGVYGLRGSKEGRMSLVGREGDVYELLTQVVELLASDSLVIGHGSSSGSGHQLEHRATYESIANKLRGMVL